ncbi:MAG TPA: antibiotic biosynthesis monooxygenase [Anaerolineae bacterium]|nr:antibiotic biosynthesis monooxygenase [Anaerolineae bacterium]
MNDNIFWLFEVEIKDGQYDSFKSLMEEMVAATQANEPGALNYEWYISEDKTKCSIYERYADSGAVLAHLGNFGKNYAGRFMSMVKVRNFTVYGDPNEAASNALTGAGAKIIGRWGGFVR